MMVFPRGHLNMELCLINIEINGIQIGILQRKRLNNKIVEKE